MTVAIGPGDEHESRKLISLMESIKIKSKKGRPRKRPKKVYADTKYGTPLIRFYLDKKHIKSQIPSSTKKRRPGRPRIFDEATYKKTRSNIERFFGWLKNFKKLTLRYERLARVFLAFILVACFLILWRVLK